MVSQIKAIIVRHPFWSEIADGSKATEYRSWGTHFRGWLAIVAARRPDSGHDGGRVVCFVPLLDCVQTAEKEYEWDLGKPFGISERIEIPGRLGLFDVTGLIPEHVKAALPPDPAKHVDPGVKRKRPKGDGSIHAAARIGNLTRVKALIKADPESAFAKDKKGKTPMSYAVSGGSAGVYTFLYKLYKARKLI